MTYRKLKKRAKFILNDAKVWKKEAGCNFPKYLNWVLWYMSHRLPIYRYTDIDGILHEAYIPVIIMPSYYDYLKFKKHANRSKSKGNKNH